MGAEWACLGTTCRHLKCRGFYFSKVSCFHKGTSHIPESFFTMKECTQFWITQDVEITLSKTFFLVLESMIFIRKRKKTLCKHSPFTHEYRLLTFVSSKNSSGHLDEVAVVDNFFKKSKRLLRYYITFKDRLKLHAVVQNICKENCTLSTHNHESSRNGDGGAV